MTTIDWSIVIMLLLLSGVLYLTGLLRHLLAVAVLALAGLAAWRFGPVAGGWLEDFIEFSPLRIGLGYLGVFIAVAVLGSLVAALISKAVRSAGLGTIDRVLGSAGGLALGLVACWLVLAAMRSVPVYPFQEADWWQESRLIPLILIGGDWLVGSLGVNPEAPGEITVELESFLEFAE